MRIIKRNQLMLDEVAISEIVLDFNSRDEIPKLLYGLQEIWCCRETREEVFRILEKAIPEKTRKDTGRPGMELWTVLVLGTLRLTGNFDYDKVQELANQHYTIRQMMGLGEKESGFRSEHFFHLQTIKDNVRLLTPELLSEINGVVVRRGHRFVCPKGVSEEELNCKCDSFPVETNVHFPTDINLLLDAMNKVIGLMFGICALFGILGWRKKDYNLKKVKRLYRKAQRSKKEKDASEAYRSYIEIAREFIERAQLSLSEIGEKHGLEALCRKEIKQIQLYMDDAVRQIDQIERRKFKLEVIPHQEKVFSLFQRHTEWIVKGKSGVLQELGLNVCVLVDQHQFILHHHVMVKQTDEKVAVPIIFEAKRMFPDIKSCSFDKGFHSHENQIELARMLETVVLPKKGRLSEEEKQRESSNEFVQARSKHSVVESSINALENHGLDRCPDHGLDGFQRYVALAVVARNLQILGNIVQQKKKSDYFRKKRRLKKAA